MANTRTETFDASDEHGDLDYVLRDAPNPNSDYGQRRTVRAISPPTTPAHHYEKPKPGRSNWDALPDAAKVQEGMSDAAIAEQDAIMKEGVAAARRQLADTAIPTVVEQPTLFE